MLALYALVSEPLVAESTLTQPNFYLIPVTGYYNISPGNTTIGVPKFLQALVGFYSIRGQANSVGEAPAPNNETFIRNANYVLQQIRTALGELYE